MSMTPGQNQYLGLSRLKLFLALSRTQHGLIDMATPCLCALLWLGEIPSLRIVILGLLTTFAGYTAVYALNDVVDYRADKDKRRLSQPPDSSNYLDDVLVRHPMADGLMALKEGVIWVLAWSIIAIIGAYLLNPMCVIIFICGCSLEVIYCLLLKISHFRTLVSGAVKTTGAIAAIFAVDPNPSPLFVIFLFLWLFFWEIGGQNIPADWTDMEEDRRFQAKTIPVRFGPERASVVILGSVILSILLNVIVLGLVQREFGSLCAIGFLLVGIYLLLIPAARLHRTKARLHAIELFNKASFYPLVLFVIIIIGILV
jgi:4-hydroxybenzoate polyprenyltransferase